jgi:hypothetical protein
MRKIIWLPLVFALGCVHAPATLTPQGTADFNATQVIKTLDLLRDAAINANAQTPPLLTTPTTRKIVNFHALALKTIDASRSGWKPAVSVALFQLMADPSLLPTEVQFLQPYFNVAKAIIDAYTPPQASLYLDYQEAA